MRALVLAVLIAWVPVTRQATAPVVVPMLSDGVGAGFVLEMENTSGAELTVVKLLGTCRFRIDGVEERYSGGGSSGAVRVAAGEKWKEVVKFLALRRDPSTRRPAEALWSTVAAYREAVVQLSAGRHVVSFRCRNGEWSTDVPFYWDTPNQ